MESEMSSPGLLAGEEIEATVGCLKQQFEALREHEVNRMRGSLGQLSCAQQNAIDLLTHGIVDQILETPINVLKAVSREDDSTTIIEMVRQIFKLGEVRAAGSSGCNGSSRS